MYLDHQQDLENLESLLGISFQDKSLLLRAFTHSSYAKRVTKGSVRDNERLEYLGDAVLKFLAADYLFRAYPNENEGVLSKMQSTFISDQQLGEMAKRYQFGEYLLMSYGEERNGGRERISNLANAFEALLGALYLDQGVDAVSAFLTVRLRQWFSDFSKEELKDPKTTLQELTHSHKLDLPVYDVVSETGPDHMREFEVSVTVVVHGVPYSGGATGKSKKEAERLAASALLDILATVSF